MFQKIASMYRDLKHQYTLQALLAIQNLKPTASFCHPTYINQQNRSLQSRYKWFRLTCKTSNLVHRKCGIAMILDLILMVTGARRYARISSSHVTVYGGPRLVREHHSGAQLSSSPALMDSISSPLRWCTKVLNTPYPVNRQWTDKVSSSY